MSVYIIFNTKNMWNETPKFCEWDHEKKWIVEFKDVKKCEDNIEIARKIVWNNDALRQAETQGTDSILLKFPDSVKNNKPISDLEK